MDPNPVRTGGTVRTGGVLRGAPAANSGRNGGTAAGLRVQGGSSQNVPCRPRYAAPRALEVADIRKQTSGLAHGVETP